MAIMKRKKNAWVPKGFAGVKRDFRNKIERNIKALRANDVEAADLVRVHDNDGNYEFTIGEGGNNWYVANTHAEQGEVLYSGDLNEIANFYETEILVAFDNGELDAGLEANFNRRKAAGSKMQRSLKERHLADAEAEAANDYPTRPDLTAVA
jgi:hypothetical protein